ncbi:hypothetical protein EC973_008521 [Apophysomyces ossiformis]|uniref:FAS1 domain-containing protein n=1 Tax=Apophysomyces ossiformis TaxID=679940 RepID=A0A8H7BN56_9FUNG|nr:hypothetical protein EC973_008521 [Apophysomyces ossiformis]
MWTRLWLILTLCVLGTLAQLNTLSIIQILNASQLSPAYKFVQLLESSPDYQPMINLLSQPGNLTFFVPSDEVFDQLSLTTSSPTQTSASMTNPTANPSGMAGASTMQTPSGNSTTTSSQMTVAQPQTTQTGGGGSFGRLGKIRSAVTNRVLQADSDGVFVSEGAQTFAVMDLIRYHLVNKTYNLPDDLQSNTSVVNTLLTNQTLDASGQGAPLLIHKYGNSSMNCTVGNGLGEANLTTGGIVASNGVIYVINKVLVPPNPVSEVALQIPDLAGINFFLQIYENVASQLDNITNATFFAPVNDALRDLDFRNMDNNTLQALLTTHIVQGIYYTANLTNANATTSTNTTGGGGGGGTNTTSNATTTGANTMGSITASPVQTGLAFLFRRQNGPSTGNNTTTGGAGGNNATSTNTTVTTFAGTPLTIQPINATSFMVGNATVVRSDILVQNGVLHLIDKVLEPTISSTNNNTNTTQPSGTSMIQSIQTTTQTSNTPTPTTTSPTSGANSGIVQDGFRTLLILLITVAFGL